MSDRSPISSLHSDIIQTHILPRLDGPDLALTSSVSSELHSVVSTEERLWKEVATETWPSITDPQIQRIISSFPGGHRSFYSDAFPPPAIHGNNNVAIGKNIGDFSKMISAVDLKYKNHVLCSGNVDMANWLDPSVYRLELQIADFVKHDKKDICSFLPASLSGERAINNHLEENLTVSWILIDPTSKRAVNLSSSRPVGYCDSSPSRHTFRYTSILPKSGSTELAPCSVIVTMRRCYCNEKLRLEKISLCLVIPTNNYMMGGPDRWPYLQAALEGGRAKRSEEAEMLQHYIQMRTERNERQRRRDNECCSDRCCLFLLRFMTCICIVASISLLFPTI